MLVYACRYPDDETAIGEVVSLRENVIWLCPIKLLLERIYPHTSGKPVPKGLDVANNYLALDLHAPPCATAIK